MNQTKTMMAIALSAMLVLPTVSCKKEGCMDADATNYDADAKKDDGTCEFVEGCMDMESFNYNADAKKDDGSCIEDFTGWESWMLEATLTGYAEGVGAHMQNDSTVTRKIYFKDGQDRSGDSYPEGTLIVKHASKADGSAHEYTAMAKRYSGFNSANNDWEWFMINADGTIADRGANLMSGMCGNCHKAGASGKDYVYSKS